MIQSPPYVPLGVSSASRSKASKRTPRTPRKSEERSDGEKGTFSAYLGSFREISANHQCPVRNWCITTAPKSHSLQRGRSPPSASPIIPDVHTKGACSEMGLLVDGHLNKGNCFTVWGSQQSVLNDSALIASGLIGGTSNLIAILTNENDAQPSGLDGCYA